MTLKSESGNSARRLPSVSELYVGPGIGRRLITLTPTEE